MTTIKGESALLKKLQTLPARQKAKVKAAMEAQADEITDMMRRLVPVDKGALRASISWVWGSNTPKRSIKIGTVGNGDMVITIFAGDAKAFYAGFQEWGTVKMPANPFFYPSWRANKKPTRRAIQAALRAAAKEVASGG